MGRKKKPESDDKEQSARFMQVAKDVAESMDKSTFQQVLGKIIKTSKTKKE